MTEAHLNGHNYEELIPISDSRNGSSRELSGARYKNSKQITKS